MDIYRELILDHYKHPRNFGHLDHPDVTVSDANVSCGDRVVMELQLTTDNRQPTTILDIRFSGEGCAINQASASMLTEKVKGMMVKDVLAITTDDIIELLGTELTPSRIKCAVLPLEVLHKALISR